MAPESEVPVVKQRWQFFTGRCHVVLQFCGAIIYGSPLVVDPAVVAAKHACFYTLQLSGSADH